jgi:Leucine-rich repeat (LRR) protein
MNINLTLLSYLLTINKKSKLFNFDNYYWKLICILDFNNFILNNNSKFFYSKYKTFSGFENIIKMLKLKCTIYRIEKILMIDQNFYNIKIIPNEIDTLIYLKYFSITNSQLKMIPKQLGNLINLIYLSVSVNQIKIIPKEISKLINLYRLDFSSNYIEVIPEELGNLINLEYLNIRDNQIKIIPNNINILIKIII